MVELLIASLYRYGLLCRGRKGLLDVEGFICRTTLEVSSIQR